MERRVKRVKSFHGAYLTQAYILNKMLPCVNIVVS